MAQNIRYAIVTPVRDEEKHIETTIESVVRQTIRPTAWVIVDDGSSDRTGDIIDRYAAQFPWIRAVHRPNRGWRNASTGAIEAFYAGYRSIEPDNWEFVVNLDGDLQFEPDYFESCFTEFDREPKLGIAGGTLYHFEHGALALEANPLFHVRGATKIYRRSCWDAIGGPLRTAAWDTLDEVKANMLGWRSRSLPNVRAIHLRPTGAAGGVWRDSVKSGRADYYAGYHPLFMLLKCAKRTILRPLSANGIGHLWGFVGAYISGAPQVSEGALICYLRRQQLRRLLLRETIWK